jgi:hypothetical protein
MILGDGEQPGLCINMYQGTLHRMIARGHLPIALLIVKAAPVRHCRQAAAIASAESFWMSGTLGDPTG